MHDKQHVIGHQSAGCPNLNGEEVRGGYDVPMRFQERLPRGALLSFRCRFYATPVQYILDRVRCNDRADISKCTLYSVVSPGDILPHHAYYQIGDLLRDAGSTQPLPGIGLLLRDELTVPGKKTIWCHKRLNFIKQPAAKNLGFQGQSYPVFLGGPKPLSFELFL